MYPPPPHLQTDTYENITFPQLRLRAVTMKDESIAFDYD